MGVIARRAALLGLLAAACGPPLRAAVSFRLIRRGNAPPDAAVYIDEEYIGPLGYVVARGVRLPVGEHRLTVERDGYFPFDALVVADRYPVKLDVELVRIPD